MKIADRHREPTGAEQADQAVSEEIFLGLVEILADWLEEFVQTCLPAGKFADTASIKACGGAMAHLPVR